MEGFTPEIEDHLLGKHAQQRQRQSVMQPVASDGIVAPHSYPRLTSNSPREGHNIFWTEGIVTAAQRAALNGHSGCVVWLTGLSGAGKSTIAMELEWRLFNLGRRAYVLDGDKVRHGLCSDLAFSPDDRRENIRRVGEVAKLLADAGMICITALISPYRDDRQMVRRMMRDGDFIEVYVNAPLSVCEERDPKGLYAKARANTINGFTGISAPYECPLRPELEVRTDHKSVAECVSVILARL
jgi:adenylyl-sulfate kinase